VRFVDNREAGAVMALGLLLWCAITGAAPPPPGVIAAPARTEQVVDRVEALGNLRANESVTLTASVTETVSAIHFDDGDRVVGGTILVEMTSAEEHAMLEEARALVDEARTQYERVKSLARQGTAAQSLLDERRREWQTAQARLSAIESRLADRLIKAPFAGVLGLRNISVGALVEPGDRITTLDDDSVMKLDFVVPAVHVAALQPGLGVTARSRAYGEREFRGEVRSVDSRVDPVTRAVTVRVVIPNPDRALKPGMLMQVDLQMHPREALLIPEEALVPKGSRQTILVLDGDTARQRDVTVGARFPGKAEIVAGLAADEQVVTHGALKVRPGQPVRVVALDDGSRPLEELLKSLDAATTDGN